MKTLLTRIAMLALPALLTVGCGGDDLFGLLDGGSGTCPSGTTLHRIQAGAYNTTNAQVISDGCGGGTLMPADIMTVRNVANDTTTGTITVSGSNGGLIGTGPLRCNTGSLSASQTVTKTPCTYDSSRTSTMVITGDSTFTLDFTDMQSNFASSGGTCTMTQACTTHFTVTMQHQ